MQTWLNGKLVPAADAAVPATDLGLLHGAGVFTTMRAFAGRVFRLPQHLQRIRQSCETFSLPLSYTDVDLTRAIDELLTANQLAEARLRLTVTRGTIRETPERGMLVEPTVLLTAVPAADYPPRLYETGMSVVLLDRWKLNPYDPQAGHKTLDYFSRFTAMHEAQQRGVNECVWFNVHNLAQSSSLANLFLVSDGTLVTPPTQDDLADEAIRERCPYPRSNVLPGTTRGAVLEIAQAQGIAIEIRAVSVEDLLKADEVFLSNAMMLAMPVCRIERHEVGSGKPGDLTGRVLGLLRESARGEH
jgi:branched-chain amino acid aminotransferase